MPLDAHPIVLVRLGGHDLVVPYDPAMELPLSVKGFTARRVEVDQ